MHAVASFDFEYDSASAASSGHGQHKLAPVIPHEETSVNATMFR
jgi:hypothetical protein